MTPNDSVVDIVVEGDSIRLGQFLQLSQLLYTGGEAKEAIASGAVTVNGEVERRRGRQLQSGDVVTFQDRSARVRY